MTNRNWIVLLLMTFALATGSGCVYRASISQGNLIKEENLVQLELGMTKNQVRFLLGTPMIDDPFSKERWDYIYYLKLRRDDATFKRWVSVFFENDVVSEIRRDQELNPGL
jgi:outer membrane protein assembly factor BamE